MSTSRPTSVEYEASLRFIDPDAITLPIRATLRYDQKSPYAVRMTFHLEHLGEGLVDRVFARELLEEGLNEPTGIGYVNVRPWASPRGDFVALTLSSPEGDALFEMPREMLVRFLRRTYLVVPRGEESKYLDIDKALERLVV